MGLYNFPSPAEGLLHVLVMNTIFTVALFKNIVRYVLQVVGINGFSPNLDDDQSSEGYPPPMPGSARRVVSITRFKSLCQNRSCGGGGDGDGGGGGGGMWLWSSMECCVCLCKYESDEEVSELFCKHFFHKGCLEKWFDNQHTTCPLCRSIL